MGGETGRLAPRKFALAALLALFATGAGYFYVGRPRRALIQLGLMTVAAFAFWHGLWGFMAIPAVYAAAIVASLSLTLFCLVDVVRLARNESNYRLGPTNRVWLYAVGAAVAAALVLPDIAPTLRSPASARLLTLPSVSMEPTLMAGDRILADMGAFRKVSPASGDMVTFAHPKTGATHIARIVALPGQSIEMRQGHLHIDGTAVDMAAAGTFISSDDVDRSRGVPSKQSRETLPNGRAFLTLPSSARSVVATIGPIRVPVGHVFVMGDNRDNSIDSRMAAHMGPVPIVNIRGRVTGTVYGVSTWLPRDVN